MQQRPLGLHGSNSTMSSMARAQYLLRWQYVLKWRLEGVPICGCVCRQHMILHRLESILRISIFPLLLDSTPKHSAIIPFGKRATNPVGESCSLLVIAMFNMFQLDLVYDGAYIPGVLPMAQRILVIEDEDGIIHLLNLYLK